MQELSAFDPGVEVRGGAVQSIIEGVPDKFAEKGRALLADHGIENPKRDEWLPQEAYLEAYETIMNDIGDATLKRIGRSTPENAEWPAGIGTPFEALDSLNDAYQLNHRGGDAGFYEAERLGERTARVRCKTPYPCPYDESLVKSIASKFTDSYVIVEETGDTCREEGGDVCEYEVKW